MLYGTLAVLLIIPLAVESADEWSHKTPGHWIRMRGNRYCRGLSQSPIDLHFNSSILDHRLHQLVLDELPSKTDPIEIFNSGHTVQANLRNRYLLKHIAPGMEYYKVEQIHFHWGQTDNVDTGSEHLHEGKAYPLEMHMVTYSSFFSTIREAGTNTRALAVVGTFFELSQEANPLFQPIVNALADIQNQSQKINVPEEFDLKALISESRLARYYRYDGSLTTPPCYETVLWTVLVDPIKISIEQLNAFKQLYDGHGHLIENTYRKVRPLNTRKVFRSFHYEDMNIDKQHRETQKSSHAQYLTYNVKLVSLLMTGLLIWML